MLITNYTNPGWKSELMLLSDSVRHTRSTYVKPKSNEELEVNTKKGTANKNYYIP